MSFELDCKATVVMIVVELCYAAVIVTGRAALSKEMNSMVFVVYRQFIAFLLIAPFCCFTRRRETKRYYMGWKNFWLIFLFAFVGVTLNQITYYAGMHLTSSSAASAVINLVPAITFIIAYTIGLEKVHLESLRSVAKIIGTVVGVSGAVAMAVLKGPKLLNSIQIQPTNSPDLQQGGGNDTWLIGCLSLLGCACFWSFRLIFQVHVTERYPDHTSLTAWICLMSSVQSGILTVFFEPITLSTWEIHSTLELFCCLFAGLSSVVIFFAQAWCIEKRGPLFFAVFNPLCTVFVTFTATVFMHEELYTGSLIGAFAVIVGLYIVLWGQAEDRKDMKEEITSDQNDQTTSSTRFSDNTGDKIDLEEPLLLGKNVDA